MMNVRDDIKAYLVGGGIASLAAAVYLLRDGHIPGKHIQILEESRLGGSLDAAGSPEQGYSMRGSRMYGAAYVLTYELLAGIPSLDDPSKSVALDMLEFWESTPWNAKARLVENGKIIDPSILGFDNKDRVELVKLLFSSENTLGTKRIEDCFEPHFFETNFWCMWCSMFGFEPWHSAIELRRYLLRFLRLFPDLATLKIIHSTRYNTYDTVIRPLLSWLAQHGVQFDTGVQVTDLDFARANGRKAVRAIRCLREGKRIKIDVGESDLVIVTIGSMTADSSFGSMSAPPVLTTVKTGGSWTLWERLAEKDPAFGRPSAFCGHSDQTKWITFTVTHLDDRFFKLMERFSGSPAGRGGLVTLKSSSWLLTFHLFHPPAYAGQPEGIFVWWGYGLFPDRVGAYVKKRMSDCSGEEILVETFSHLGFQPHIPALLSSVNCIPCMLPYAASQFMPRAKGDRPNVIPEGTVNFAFIGQYCEIPDDVVYTIEYSVHSARLAVASLLGFAHEIPPTYKGLEHPYALVHAMKIILG